MTKIKEKQNQQLIATNKKLVCFSSEDCKSLIDSVVKKKAEITGLTESRIIEEYIIGGIIRDFPKNEESHKLLKLMQQRYQWLDKEFFK